MKRRSSRTNRSKKSNNKPEDLSPPPPLMRSKHNNKTTTSTSTSTSSNISTGSNSTHTTASCSSISTTATNATTPVLYHESSHPITLLELMQRQSSKKSSKKKKIKSCLVKKTKHHPSEELDLCGAGRRRNSNCRMSGKMVGMVGMHSCHERSFATDFGNGSSSSCPRKKSVTFATNSFNDRVWALIKPVDIIYTPQHEDDDGSSSYWWSVEELDEIREKLIGIANHMENETDMGLVLKQAYETLEQQQPLLHQRSSSSSGDSAHWSQFYSKLTDYHAIGGDDEVRGLESHIAAGGAVNSYKARHREAVLCTQELLWEEGRDRSFHDDFDEDDEDLLGAAASGSSGVEFSMSSLSSSSSSLLSDLDEELIRKQSLKHSKACRLMAAKMALCDAQEAVYF